MTCAASIAASIFLVAALAGCSRNTGSFDVDEPAQQKWDNLMALVSFKPLPRQPQPTDRILCPEIQILDGTAADRIYGPGTDQTNANVRYQFSIENVARDCEVRGGQVAMKIGVAGRVLLGPLGSAGSFDAPVRVAIVQRSDDSPVLSKLYQVPTSVPDGQTEAPFTLVTEPLSVPATGNFKEDYAIKVGFDPTANDKGSGAQAPRHHRRHAAPSQASSAGGGAD
ncbi:MAG TPA: hypothetical protein VKV77_05090 [Methylovirgula sp.]|nr:hypothetical protein [Methylovirgula sp.]